MSRDLVGTLHDAGGKVRHAVAADVVSDAVFSPCERYRYRLSRWWDTSLPAVMFLMMNPSVADIHVNDPTVAKCQRLAVRWGYGGLLVGNVCAYRATAKERLLDVVDPVGEANMPALLAMASEAALVVVAHGKLPRGLQHHASTACATLARAGAALHTLKLAGNGTPWHPLYIKEDTLPERWLTSLV